MRDVGGKQRLNLEAQTRIDRLEFGMNSGFPLVSRDVDLVISSEAQPALTERSGRRAGIR